MKSKNSNILSVAIVLVYIFAIFYFIFGVIHDFKTGEISSSESFSQISKETADLLTKMPPESPQFTSSFIQIITTKADTASVNFEYQGQTLYHFPEESFTTTSSLVKTFTTQYQTATGNAVLTVSLYMLSPFSIFSKARISFFIVLIATLFTAILLLEEYISEKNYFVEEKSEEKDDTDFFNETKDDVTVLDNEIEEIPESSIPVQDEPQESEVSEQKIEPLEADEESTQINSANQEIIKETNIANEDVLESDTIPEIEELDTTETPVKEDEIPVAEASDIQDIPEVTEEPAKDETTTETLLDDFPTEDELKSANEPNTDSLFSAETGLCKESYLLTRLESELIRAASSEQDLTLFVINIEEFNFTVPYMEQVVKLLQNYFNFKDMIFEHGDSGFCVIQANENLDSALNVAENFQTDLITILRNNNNSTTPVIGISSRSLRLIPGNRLLIEAERAADHAAEDTQSPIVAFRVDPERYRQFLSESN